MVVIEGWVNGENRPSNFWSRLTLVSSLPLFRKDDVLTIMNMTSSFSWGVDLRYRANQTLIAPGFSTYSHIYKHSSLSHSYLPFSDVYVSVSRHRLLHMWKATFFFFFIHIGGRVYCLTLLCKIILTLLHLYSFIYVNLCVNLTDKRLYCSTFNIRHTIILLYSIYRVLKNW